MITLVAAALLSASTALTGPDVKIEVADVPTVQDATETFENQNTLRCITENGGLETTPCDGANAYQYWNVHVWEDNTRQLRAIVTGRCLHDDAGLGLSAGGCYAGSDPRSANQSWYVRRWSDGTIQLRNQATGRCLDDTAPILHTAPCYPGSDPRSAYQSWF